MTSNFFNALLLPLALAIIMLGLGLSLRINDFKRVVKSKFPAISAKLSKPVKILSAVFLLIVIGGVIYQARENIVSYFRMVGIAALVFNILSIGVGYFVPCFLKLEQKQAIAIGMEIGIHNGTLAIFIALSVIGNGAMSIPPVIYSLIMFFTAAAFGYAVNLRKGDTA